MKITLLRNATLKLNYANKLFLIDPDLAEKFARDPLAEKQRNPTVSLPIPAQEIIAGIELILVSHLHQDHFDAVAKDMLPKDLTLFCQPEDEEKIREHGFEQVHVIVEKVEWEGITITRTAAQHGSGVWAERLAPVSGFVFAAEGEPTVYWAGDTINYPPVQQVIAEVKPNVIVTHSGGASLGDSGPILMDVEQTIALCKTTPEAKLVAVHLEALDHCPVTRVELMEAAKVAEVEDQLIIPKDGETIAL